jgi:hypothetical protein
MKLSDIPIDSVYFDVDSVSVVKLPGGEFIAFDFTPASRPYLNRRNAELEGDALTAEDFIGWVTMRKHQLDEA